MKSTPDDTQCFVRWLQLKRSAEYQELSREIRELIRQEQDAEQKFSEANTTYQALFPEGLDSETTGPSARAFREAAQAYGIAEHTFRICAQKLEEQKKQVAQQFGLFMWWDPEDRSITYDTASCIFDPTPVVYAVELSDQDRDGWNLFVDKHGWLTIRVNTKAPLEEVEALLGKLIRINRPRLRTRQHSDKNRLALEVYVKYEDVPNFKELALQFKRKRSTVQGLYVRGYALVHGTPPAGTTKQRRASRLIEMKDPAAAFAAHLPTCQRCHKADTIEQMCSKFKYYVAQD